MLTLNQALGCLLLKILRVSCHRRGAPWGLLLVVILSSLQIIECLSSAFKKRHQRLKPELLSLCERVLSKGDDGAGGQKGEAGDVASRRVCVIQ